MNSENTAINPAEGPFDWKAAERDLRGVPVVPEELGCPGGDDGLADLLGYTVTPCCNHDDAHQEEVPVAEAGPVGPVLAEATEADDEDEDVVDDEVDPNADAHLWPVTVDDRGRPTTETAKPNPEAMRIARRRAEATSEADVDVLAEAISEPEAREIIHRAADQRGFERELDAKVAHRRAELASDGARQQAEHEARLAEVRRRRENRRVAALDRRDRALDPTSRIVRLAAAERWVPWIAVTPAVLAAVLGAVNVGVSLDHLSPGTQLINWMVEPLVTLPLIAILVAQILGAIGEGADNPYRRLERVLVFVAVLLNVGLHVYIDGLVPSALVWAIVPAGLAISANLVPRLIRSLREALAKASVEPHTTGSKGHRTAPVAVVAGAESTWTAPGLSQVSAESTLTESRSDAELFTELAEAVRDGRVDPQTGRAINPNSAESIRRTLNVGKERARALREAYAKLAAA